MLMGGDGAVAILEVEEGGRHGHLSGSLIASDRSLIPSTGINVNQKNSQKNQPLEPNPLNLLTKKFESPPNVLDGSIYDQDGLDDW
jgi:hypothetical protein